MQTSAWLTAWHSVFREEYEPCPVVVGDPGSPDAMAPLVRPNQGHDARLELAARNMYEPMDLVFRDDQALECLAERMVALRQPLLFSRVPEDSPTIPALTSAARRRSLVKVLPSVGWPAVELDHLESPEHVLNPGRRSDLRRARRRAERLGDVTFDFVTPEPGDVEPYLDLAYAVEHASWKGRNGTALSSDAQRGTFFRRYCRAATKEGALRIGFARIDGRAVAMQIASVIRRRLWLFKIGYDEEFAACSPGQLLMLAAIGAARDEGLASVELLGRDEPWTRMWATHVRPCTSVGVYPSNLRSCRPLLHDLLRAVGRGAPCDA